MTNKLWPSIEPFNHFYLEADNHQLYVEQCGNRDGIPIIFLHGGPGGGCHDEHRQLFDPAKYHIILFDQRGCGRSTPHASIENNKPFDSVNDIERIRNHLNIDQWHLFGGSWGSTLALLYAIAYPSTVKSMILRGVFLGTQAEIDWIYESVGCAQFHPEHYQYLIEGLDPDKSIVKQYNDQLILKNEAYAHKWATWEAINSAIDVSKETIANYTESKLALSLSVISAHFFANALFLENNYILNHIDKIKDIKTMIVQGRHDLLCPPKAAYLLSQKLNNVSLNIIPDAGHTLFEKGTLNKILKHLNEDIKSD